MLQDGHFVNNWTFGPCVVEAVHRHIRRMRQKEVFCDCHLYATAPQDWVEVRATGSALLECQYHLRSWPRSRPSALGSKDCLLSVSSTATAARTCRALQAQMGSNTLLCKQRLQRAR